MITEIIGRRGSGRTLALVYLAKEAMEAGKTVAANIHIEGAQYFGPDAKWPIDVDVTIFDAVDAWWRVRNNFDPFQVSRRELMVSYFFPQYCDDITVDKTLNTSMHDAHTLVLREISKPCVSCGISRETKSESRIDARPLFLMYDTTELIPAQWTKE